MKTFSLLRRPERETERSANRGAIHQAAANKAKADGIRKPLFLLEEGHRFLLPSCWECLMQDWKTMSTEERVEALKKGIDQGLSASIMAGWFLNCSRNAIIGVAHRNKLNLGNRIVVGSDGSRREISSGKAGPARRHLAGPRRRPRLVAVRAAPAPKIEAAAEAEGNGDGEFEVDTSSIADEVLPAGGGVHIEDSKDHHCKWPMWPHHMLSTERVPYADLIYCGDKPKDDKSPYCEFHTCKGTAVPVGRK